MYVWSIATRKSNNNDRARKFSHFWQDYLIGTIVEVFHWVTGWMPTSMHALTEIGSFVRPKVQFWLLSGKSRSRLSI